MLEILALCRIAVKVPPGFDLGQGGIAYSWSWCSKFSFSSVFWYLAEKEEYSSTCLDWDNNRNWTLHVARINRSNKGTEFLNNATGNYDIAPMVGNELLMGGQLYSFNLSSNPLCHFIHRDEEKYVEEICRIWRPKSNLQSFRDGR